MEGLRTRSKNTEVSHQCSVNMKDHFPQPAGNTTPSTIQEAAGLCCKGTIAGSQTLSQALIQLVSPLSVLGHGVFPLHMQDLTFLFTELQKVFDKVLVNPFYWSVEIPLIGSTPMQHISHSFLFCIVCISKV